MEATKENLKNFIERWEAHPNSPYVFDVEENVIAPLKENEYKKFHDANSILSSRGEYSLTSRTRTKTKYRKATITTTTTTATITTNTQRQKKQQQQQYNQQQQQQHLITNEITFKEIF